MKEILPLIILFGFALANSHAQVFDARVIARQSSCSDVGYVDCGAYCIVPGYSCCSDGSGCQPGTYCSIGSDGVIGCCEDGEICEGPGGVITGTLADTSTIEDHTTSTMPIPENPPSLTVTETPSETPSETLPETIPSTSTPPAVSLPSPVPTTSGTMTESMPPVSTAGAVMNAMPGSFFSGVVVVFAAMLL